MTNQTNLSNEKWRSDERKLKTWLARIQKSHGKVKTYARVRAKASKVDDEAASHMHSLHFPMDKVGYTSESPRGKTLTASRCVAAVRSQEQERTATPPFLSGRRSSGWRRWLCSEWYRPSGDRYWSSGNWSSCGESGSDSSSAADQEVCEFSMARKRNEQDTNWWVKWQRSSRHVRQMFPPKPLPPSVFRFGCARWRVEQSHDVFTKAPSSIRRAHVH